MIYAYNDLYLYDVMKNMAAMTDMAINAEGLDPDEFGSLFAESSVARKIENAIPDMLAGKSGAEMLSIILCKRVDYCVIPPDRTPEYWAGWILAMAQWELNVPFKQILDAMTLSSIINMYHPYHEADESKSIEAIKERLPKKESGLKYMRNLRKLTQEQLATLSGVNIRSIRSYEQGENSIMKAQVETVQMLSATLCCSIEDLL